MHATPRRKPGFRWIWVAMAVIVVGVLTVGMIRLQETACAASTSTEGTAVYHNDWSVVLCSMGPLPSSGLYVSLSAEEYGRASLCGAYLEVSGPDGTVRAQIVDRCRACAPGRLDLSERAFARIGDRSKGIIAVRYRLVRDPQPASRLAVRLKPGSSEDWLALLVLGHGNPVTRVDLRADGFWRPMRRGLDNHWSISRPGSAPYRVRVTDRYGNQAVLPRVEFAPSTVQSADVRMYGSPQQPSVNSATPLPTPTPASSPTSSPNPSTTSPHCS